LRGPNLDEFGPRFIALSDAYDLELRRAAHLAWKELSKAQSKQMAMHEGVYAFVGGPKYVQALQTDILRSSLQDTRVFASSQ
jgi:purine-nucleoside phosphorylase